MMRLFLSGPFLSACRCFPSGLQTFAQVWGFGYRHQASVLHENLYYQLVISGWRPADLLRNGSIGATLFDRVANSQGRVC